MTALHAAMRSASVDLLQSYGEDNNLKLQVYRARPRSINPPCAFVDLIRETREYTGPTLVQRTPQAELVVIHGLFDSGEAADQKDAFVDGFLEWVDANPHAVGANATIGGIATEDIPNYVPDWLPPDQQRVYYATQITLEGYAEN